MNWNRYGPLGSQSSDGLWRVYRRFPQGFVRYHLYHKEKVGWKLVKRGGRTVKEMRDFAETLSGI